MHEYKRFEDDINIILNSVQTAPQLPHFTQCDDASNDGIESFDVTTLDTQAQANLPASTYTVTYHITNQNAIDGIGGFTSINVSNSQIVYIRAIDNNTGCVYVSTVQLIVNPFPIITAPSNVDICSNGGGNVMLTDYNSEITNNNLNYSVTYHFSQVDADTGANAIESPYTPTNTTEQLFIRVVDITNGCVAFTDITLQVLDSPNVNQEIQQINACELDDNGIEVFDLTSVINDVLQGLTNVTVAYHITAQEAQNNENPIPDPTQFENTIPDLQIVYIRIENNNNSCFEIVPIELHTNILETGTNIRNFGVCDEAPDDNEGTFDLMAITTIIANNLEDITITYYETVLYQVRSSIINWIGIVV